MSSILNGITVPIATLRRYHTRAKQLFNREQRNAWAGQPAFAFLGVGGVKVLRTCPFVVEQYARHYNTYHLLILRQSSSGVVCSNFIWLCMSIYVYHQISYFESTSARFLYLIFFLLNVQLFTSDFEYSLLTLMKEVELT